MLTAISIFAQEKKEETQLDKKPLEDFSQSVKEKGENQPQESEFRPNKKSLDDFVQNVQEKVDRKQVDLTKSFSVELTGDITKDGKLDRKTSKFIKSAGDEAMIEVGKSFIEVLSDSGLFYYLKQMGIEKINFTIGQNDSQTYGVIRSEQSTIEKAKNITSGLNMVIKLVSLAKGTGAKKIDADTEFLLSGVKTFSESKSVKISFDYEKLVIQEMIKRKPKESEAKKPSGK